MVTRHILSYHNLIRPVAKDKLASARRSNKEMMTDCYQFRIVLLR